MFTVFAKLEVQHKCVRNKKNSISIRAVFFETCVYLPAVGYLKYMTQSWNPLELSNLQA